jgi:putative flippase GtrA
MDNDYFLQGKINFLRQLYKTLLKKVSEWNPIILFLFVGFIGFCVNMAVLTFALWEGVDYRIAIISGIVASTVLLFVLDRHFVFSHASHRAVTPQLIGFLIVCFLGGVLNYLVSIFLLFLFPGLMVQLAELVGIIVGATFNYFCLCYMVFKK